MRIARKALEIVLDHAAWASPSECCGILLAENGSGVASLVLRAANEEAEDPRQAFVLGHHAHLRAVEMEFAGRATIVGYYHSHPHGGSEPSARDRELAAEGVAYLIASRAGRGWQAAAWRFDGDEFVGEPLEVV